MGMTNDNVNVKPGEKKKIQPINLLVGACLNIFEVSTLGQPFEVLKTHMAANRGDTLPTAVQKTISRGGLGGFCKNKMPFLY